MSKFTPEQLDHIQRLSSFLSSHYKWKCKAQDNLILVEIRTDEWFTLAIRLTPHQICMKWLFGNTLFHCIIGWLIVRLFKGDLHQKLETHTTNYLQKVYN